MRNLFGKIFDLLLQKRTGNILAIVVVLGFLILGLIKLYPFDNNLPGLLHTGDDWTSYAKLGLDIKRNGLLIPSIKSPYYAPAGFLYNYFLALCFFLFGESDVPVLIIQLLMLGFSVALIYWTFRDKMRNLTGIIFLVALSFFALADVYKYYAFRLLSENLAYFLSALFFFCFIRGFEKDKFILQLVSAALMGLLVLLRANYFLFAVVLVFIVRPFYFCQGKKGIRNFALFVSILVLCGSLLGLRNYLICGHWHFFPAQGAGLEFIKDAYQVPQSIDLSQHAQLYARWQINKPISAVIEFALQLPGLFFIQLFKRILFCLGFSFVLNPYFRFRPHWILMWLGYFFYLFLHFRERKKFPLWEKAVHLYLFFYYVPLILVAMIENYGFRMLIPAVNFALVFPFLLWDEFKTKLG